MEIKKEKKTYKPRTAPTKQSAYITFVKQYAADNNLGYKSAMEAIKVNKLWKKGEKNEPAKKTTNPCGKINIKIEKLIDDINKKNISDDAELNACVVKKLFENCSKIINEKKAPIKNMIKPGDKINIKIEKLIDDINKKNISNDRELNAPVVENLFEKYGKIINEKKALHPKPPTKIYNAQPVDYSKLIKPYNPEPTDYSKYDKYSPPKPEVKDYTTIEPNLQLKLITYALYELKTALKEKLNKPSTAPEEIRRIKRGIKTYKKDIIRINELLKNT